MVRKKELGCRIWSRNERFVVGTIGSSDLFVILFHRDGEFLRSCVYVRVRVRVRSCGRAVVRSRVLQQDALLRRNGSQALHPVVPMHFT